MGWITLYITGRTDFREEVRRKVNGSDLKLMPGYMGVLASPQEFHDLYWIDESVTLREFKEAIGSKLIWKYRLKFYPSLEEFIESQNKVKKNKLDFTDEDIALLEAAMKSTSLN